jgi:hypothetical protein
VAAFPSFLFWRHSTVYWPLNATDLVERLYAKREAEEEARLNPEPQSEQRCQAG